MGTCWGKVDHQRAGWIAEDVRVVEAVGRLVGDLKRG